MPTPQLADFVKAYDVRGLVPDQLNVDVAWALGAAFAGVVVQAEGATGVVIGHDMRPSSPELSRAFAAGVTSRGVDVTVIGLCSTDGLYYASGALDLPGAMFTASHNPAQYNGIKLCLAGARPVSADTGLHEIRDAVSRPEPAPVTVPGTISQRDVVEAYAAHLLELTPVSGRPLRVVVDELGRPVSPSTLTALIAARELAKQPGATVIHNLITSRFVPELVTDLGGTPVRTRVGHSFIKATMAETDAAFGGEHSGHFYFRDFWRADSGMLAALHTLAALAADDRPLSELLADYQRYRLSGEINSEVAEPRATLADVESAYAATPGATVDHLDGLTVATDDWWFNVRPSNTEPLLRLNVEGVDDPTMTRVRDEVLAIIRKD